MKYNTGIYKITNTVNDKFYIGSAVSLKKRKREHYNALKRGDHYNNYLQNSYNKHGKDNFKFEVLHYCEVDELIPLEQTEITLSECTDPSIGYNICIKAGSTLGVKPSKATREKMSKSQINRVRSKEERNRIGNILKGSSMPQCTRDKISKTLKGKVVSQITRDRLSIASKGHIVSQSQRDNISKTLKGRSLSNQHKNNIRIANKGKGNIPISAFKDGVYVGDFESITEAAIKLSVPRPKISLVISGKRNHTGGYTFKLRDTI